MPCMLRGSNKISVQQFHWLGLDMDSLMEIWQATFLYDW